MSDPVEIMARTALDHEWRAASRSHRDQLWALNKDLYLEREQRRIAALEASGWRLVHPEKISEPMKCAGDPWTEGRDFTHECLAQAIRAAPTFGDKE